MSMRRTRTYQLFRKTKNKALNIGASLVLLTTSMGATLPIFLSQKAAALGTVTVTNENSQGWSDNSPVAETRTGSTVDFIGDSAAPSAHSALHITTSSDPGTKAQYMYGVTAPLPLSSVTGELSYYTKQNSASFAAGDPSYQIQVLLNGTSGYTTLGYEPYVNEGNSAVHTGVWQYWNVGAGKFYSSHTVVSSTDSTKSVQSSQGSSLYTLAELQANFPNAVVIAYGLNVGSNNPSYDVEADNFVFNGTAYDFDLAPPAAPNLTFPADGVYRQSSNTNHSDWSAVTDPSTPVVTYNYESAYDTGFTHLAYGPSSTGTATTILNPGEPEGTYYWRVQACDAVGNCSAWSAYRTIHIDNIVPTTPTLLSPSNNGYETTNDFYFKWTDAIDASPVTYEFKDSPTSSNVDGTGSLTDNTWDSIQNGTSDQNNLTTPQIHSIGAPDGNYYWQVRAIDAAGNKSGWSQVWNMNIDTTPPATPTNLRLNNSSNHPITDGGFTNSYSVTALWDSVSDANHYVYKVWDNIPGNAYGSEAQAYVVNNASSSRPGDFNQGEGTYYIEVSSVDTAGNQSGWSTPFTVTYDKTAPKVSITAPHAGDTLHGTLTVSGTVTDVNPDHYYFVVKDSHGTVVAGPGTVYQATVSTWSWNTKNVPDGTYTIDLEARDKAGNKDASSVQTITVIVDNTPPAVPTASFTADNSGNTVNNGDSTNSKYFTFNLSAPGGTTRYQLKYWNTIPGSPFNGENNAWSPSDLSGYSSSLGVYNDQFTQGEGTHYFAFSACDAAGNCSAYSTPFVVTYDKTAPTLTINPSTGTNTTPTVTGTTSDATDVVTVDGQTATVSPTANLDGTHSWSITLPTQTVGTHTITVVSTDLAGNATQETASVVVTAAPVTLLRTLATPGTATGTGNNGSTITVTPNNNQQVLGDSTGSSSTNGNGKVKGDSTVNVKNSADKKSGNFLGLGWWWLPILVVILGFFWFLAARRSDEDDKS